MSLLALEPLPKKNNVETKASQNVPEFLLTGAIESGVR